MKNTFYYFLDKLPFVDIELSVGNNRVKLSALIDTGADYSIFPRSIAERLGIPLEQGELKVLEGAGGNIVAYVHRIILKLCAHDLVIEACFSEKEDIPEHILGRKDIFNNFKLLFEKDHFELIDHER